MILKTVPPPLPPRAAVPYSVPSLPRATPASGVNQGLVAAFSIALSFAGQSQASTVKETVSGLIGGTHTVDTKGYFGRAGADVKNAPFTIAFQYVSQDFNQRGMCRTHACNYYTARGTPVVPQSVLVSVTIKGVTQTYMPATISNIFLSLQSRHCFVLDSDADSGFGDYGRGVQM